VYGRGSVAGHLGRTEIGTHEHCRCTCKMYLAGTGYSGAREVLSSVAEARQTADGRRQTADWHSCCWGQLRSLSPETLGCWPCGSALLSRRSCGLPLARQLP
jgi:hypothetical protein